MGIITLSPELIPPPEGADLTTEEGLLKAAPLMQPKHFLLPWLAHALGTFVAAFLAAILAPSIRHYSFWIPGGLFFIGGLMMGYGARLAFGCNIGAYFGGIASFSLHGYIWGILAMAGTFLALYLRPLFGLSVPKSSDSVC